MTWKRDSAAGETLRRGDDIQVLVSCLTAAAAETESCRRSLRWRRRGLGRKARKVMGGWDKVR